MSYLLPHLHSGWAADQAILAGGGTSRAPLDSMDEVLSSVAETIKNFAGSIWLTSLRYPTLTPCMNLYDLQQSCSFSANKHIMIDLGTGNK
ncbi:hypothetical protein MKW92_026354 [Papaver armeniacum]|nr:hypothetical protein MKW92_026354 [Papaver armeniacum]